MFILNIALMQIYMFVITFIIFSNKKILFLLENMRLIL